MRCVRGGVIDYTYCIVYVIVNVSVIDYTYIYKRVIVNVWRSGSVGVALLRVLACWCVAGQRKTPCIVARRLVCCVVIPACVPALPRSQQD